MDSGRPLAPGARRKPTPYHTEEQDVTTTSVAAPPATAEPPGDSQQRVATAWNLQHPVGTRIRVWWTTPYPRSELTSTRSVAWVRPVMWSEGGIASVAVHGLEGAIPLNRVEPVTAESTSDGA